MFLSFITKVFSLFVFLFCFSNLNSAGQEDYDRLRPLSYPQTDVFLVCYSITSKASYEHVKFKWIPELKRHAPDVPMILVATKMDLRNDETALKSMQLKDAKPLTTAQGEYLASTDKNFAGFYECSALTQEGLKQVFDAAIRCALLKPNAPQSCVCTIM